MAGAIYIAGPTASGKSAIALLLAERLQGEIISVDSMQVYRGLDIGTAKPTRAERTRVPHHLVDILDLTESFDAAQFVEAAGLAEKEVCSRGHLPIFCGGTGLYFNALRDGIGSSPPSDPELRTVLEATPLSVLLDELSRSDPEAFEQIDRSNLRRVVRAIEVIRTTGRRFSEQRADWSKRSEASAGIWIGLNRERADLNRRIDQRVDCMFKAGLVEETRDLLRKGIEGNRTAMQAIGYRQVIEHLRGERSLHVTIELVKQKTRQYAKRQMTWFRRQLDLQWIDLSADDSSETFAAEIVTQFLRGQTAE